MCLRLPSLRQLSAAQNGFDSRHQLKDAERFRDVVVGAYFQSNHAVELGGFGGQHEDRDILRSLAEAPADLQAINAGQAKIENYQVP